MLSCEEKATITVQDCISSDFEPPCPLDFETQGRTVAAKSKLSFFLSPLEKVKAIYLTYSVESELVPSFCRASQTVWKSGNQLVYKGDKLKSSKIGSSIRRRGKKLESYEFELLVPSWLPSSIEIPGIGSIAHCISAEVHVYQCKMLSSSLRQLNTSCPVRFARLPDHNQIAPKQSSIAGSTRMFSWRATFPERVCLGSKLSLQLKLSPSGGHCFSSCQLFVLQRERYTSFVPGGNPITRPSGGLHALFDSGNSIHPNQAWDFLKAYEIPDKESQKDFNKTRILPHIKSKTVLFPPPPPVYTPPSSTTANGLFKHDFSEKASCYRPEDEATNDTNGSDYCYCSLDYAIDLCENITTRSKLIPSTSSPLINIDHVLVIKLRLREMQRVENETDPLSNGDAPSAMTSDGDDNLDPLENFSDQPADSTDPHRKQSKVYVIFVPIFICNKSLETNSAPQLPKLEFEGDLSEDYFPLAVCRRDRMSSVDTLPPYQEYI